MKALNRLLACLASAVLAIGIVAQERTATNVPSVERLRAHIEYLASDKLEGRRTGTAGANLAAEYIAREFSRYGLRRSIGYDTAGMSVLEADSPNRYLQKFPYVSVVELGEHNLLYVNPAKADMAQFRVGEDWMPLGFSSNGNINGSEMVFAGYGISSAELKYDDYSASAARDRVAIVFASTPDGDNPHGQFARAGEIRFKAAAARAAGARALLIITGEEKLKDDRLSSLSYDNAGEAGIPVLVISRPLAQNLLAGSLSEYQAAADARVANNTQLRTPISVRKLDLSTEVIHRLSPSANVVGILDGSDPTLKSEVIVIGAHYDHLGHGGEGSLAPREGEIHYGADDNASGTAGMLELARLFSSQTLRPRRTIVFMAFSGEEEGLLGSNYYVNHPIVPLTNTVTMINMDMIGRMRDNKLIVGGVGTAPDWRQALAAANAPERMRVAVAPASPAEMPRPVSTVGREVPGREVPTVTGSNGTPVVTLSFEKPLDLTLNEDGFGPSDHSSFYAKQIPVLFFWTGTHENYHKPSDTADKINYLDEARILGLVRRVVYEIDTSDKRPVYAVAKSESTGRAGGFRVYLGTIPNYADSNDGLLLDGVRDDSPAAKAGLKAGDKIVKLAGHDVKNVYDYTYALGEMKAGQEYEVELMRAGERLKLVITPAARK
jgi:Zn-dependent M28 family amino/carboxypeptidase